MTLYKLRSKWLNNIWVSKSAIIGCNAMLFPFAFPTIVWLVICQCYSALLSGGAGAVGGSVVLTFLGLLPCALIYAVGLSGAVYCNRNTLVDGNMDIKKRFALGIRKNAPKYLLFVFIMWASSAIAVITPTLYSYMGNSILYGVGTAVSIFQLLAIAPAMCICMMSSAFYEDKLRDVFVNSFKLYFMHPLSAIGTTLLCALPFCVCVILPFVWQLIFWVLFSVVGVAFSLVFYIWYAKRLFDRVIGEAHAQELPELGKDDDTVAIKAAETDDPAAVKQ